MGIRWCELSEPWIAIFQLQSAPKKFQQVPHALLNNYLAVFLHM